VCVKKTWKKNSQKKDLENSRRQTLHGRAEPRHCSPRSLATTARAIGGVVRSGGRGRVRTSTRRACEPGPACVHVCHLSLLQRLVVSAARSCVCIAGTGSSRVLTDCSAALNFGDMALHSHTRWSRLHVVHLLEANCLIDAGVTDLFGLP
jgi:hypothetical protein